MFIDTNILVNARVPSADQYDTARVLLTRAFGEATPPTASRQVLREYVAVVTRPQTWAIQISLQEALDDVERLAASLRIVEDGPRVAEILVALCREVPVGGRQIHDANIVATMLAYGETQLLTFNTADFRRYEDRIEIIDV